VNTPASFEARYAPPPYPTTGLKQRMENSYETSCAGGAPLRMKMGSAGGIWRRGQSLWYKHSWWAIA
jgi:hypothetical protein